MRLIDADKLREWFETERPLSVQRMVEAVDAAPTIACETCEHYDDNFYCRRKGEKYWVIRHDDFGCALYDQKEQT